MTSERGAIRQEIIVELGHLNARLEAGEISENEFEQRESILLDRLDNIQAQTGGGSNGKPAHTHQ
jgi:hypothetical protein